jgi:hypothetical protein
MTLMHTPSLITPLVATELNASHASERVTRSRGPRRRFRRRSAASPQLVPRGRTSVPPLAH